MPTLLSQLKASVNKNDRSKKARPVGLRVLHFAEIGAHDAIKETCALNQGVLSQPTLDLLDKIVFPKRKRKTYDSFADFASEMLTEMFGSGE